MRFSALILIPALLLACTICYACETPVYRYAMYRWQPRPYEIYCFHHGPLSADDQEIAKAFSAGAANKKMPANLAYTAVDVAADPQLDVADLPEDVKQIWRNGSRPAASTYLIISPIGFPAYNGRLTVADVQPLMQSPLRKEIATQLGEGMAGVFVLVKGKDTPAHDEPPEPGSLPPVTNAMARQRLQQLAADVNSGRIKPPTERPAGATGYLDKEGGDKEDRANSFDPLPEDGGSVEKNDAEIDLPEEAKLQTPATRVAVVELDRQDPAEKWLLKLLLAVEPDLPEFDEPMVFVVVGRGRVLPPFIGRGINADLLKTAFDFVTGPCSCTVADENPGVDMLMAQDWEAASKRMAEIFGREEGNETVTSSEDFFPELLTGGDNTQPQEEVAVMAAGSGARNVSHGVQPAATTLTHGTPSQDNGHATSNTVAAVTTTVDWNYALIIGLGVLLIAGVVVMGLFTLATRKAA